MAIRLRGQVGAVYRSIVTRRRFHAIGIGGQQVPGMPVSDLIDPRGTRRLLLISTYPDDKSGISGYVAHLLPHLEARYEVRTASMYFMRNPTSSLRWIGLGMRVRRYATVLIEHTPTASGPALIAFLMLARLQRVRSVVEAHESPSTYFGYLAGRNWDLGLRLYRAYERIVATLSSSYVVHTSFHREELRRMGVRKAIRTVPLPVYDPPRTRLPRTGEHFGFYGSLSPKKGIDLLLSAYQSREPGSLPPLQIIGEAAPGHEAYVLDLERSVLAEFRDHIRFRGYLPEGQKAEVFSRIALLIFPYRWISQSAALAEACSFSIPFLASDLPYFRAFVRRYGCGRTFPTGSADELGLALERFATGAWTVPPDQLVRVQQSLSVARTVERLVLVLDGSVI